MYIYEDEREIGLKPKKTRPQNKNSTNNIKFDYVYVKSEAWPEASVIHDEAPLLRSEVRLTALGKAIKQELYSEESKE